MKLSTHDSSKKPGKTDLLVVFAFEGGRPQGPMVPAGVSVPSRVMQSFKGGFRAQRLTDGATAPAPRVLVIGLGKKADVDAERLRRVAALAVRTAEVRECATIMMWAAEALEAALGGSAAVGRALAEGALMGSYRFSKGKSKPKALHLKSVVLAGKGKPFRDGATRGRIAGEANAFARDLQNSPGNMMRPRDMAAAARKLARESTRLSCKVIDEKGMKTHGMGALLSVSNGSVEPAYLIHMTYKPKARSRGKVALVGKGLTFDAGGISLKAPGKMWDMKYDMSGGAAVLGVFHALAKLDVPFEVHGLVPTSENLPDAAATKPGDLVTAMDGTTIEVLNTDAEGRLILSDALCYAVAKVKPDTIVDLATLTGAVVMALGHEFSGMFATTDRLRDDLTAAGDEVGERVWPLPLESFHKDQLKGAVADLRNINGPEHGSGSTSGAAFLWHFVGDAEWAHLDIAGTAWGGRNRDYVGGGQGSGVGVRLLLEYLEKRK